jgi:hypothetical protein
MQSDKRQTSNSYFLNALVDGAKPFYYRRGVRSLLGFPESEGGNMAFSPTLPAVGFRYVNRPLLNEPGSNRHPRNEAGRFAWNSEQEGKTENSLVTPRENIQSCEPVKEIRLKNPAPSEKDQNRKINQQKDSRKERVRQDNTVPEPKQNNGSGVLKEKLENPGVIIERSTVEILGVSEKNSSVPSPYRKEWNVRSRSFENIVQQKVSPTNFIKRALSEAPENTSTINPPSISVSATKSLQRTGVVKEKTAVAPSPSKRGNSLVDDITKAVKEKTTTAKKNEFSQITTPVTVVSEEKCMSRLSQTPDVTPSRSRYTGTDAFSRANRNAAERIGQLRHAAHQLASKVSSQQAGTSHEARQKRPAQTQPPPVQPVVIIKRFSNQTSTPCAFWERSYLGRFHLKTVR